MAAIASRFSRLDFLINAAGLSGSRFVLSIEDIDDSTWNSIVDSHVRGAFLCAREAIPLLRQTGDGRILNFSSGAVRGIPFKNTIGVPLAYSAAKAALHGFTNQLALDLGPQGISVNLLQPGFVLTESGASVRGHFENLSTTERAALLDKLPTAPRQPTEIGWAVAFLMSPAARGMTGKCFRLDGVISGVDLTASAELDTPFGAFVTLKQK
jgi:3-oxoacyl-[acyl-carrier protein] reductase